MNILVDELPTSLVIEGKEYPINADFTAVIILEQMLSDNDLTDSQKSVEMLNILFSEELPPNNMETAKQIEWYYRCGNVESEKRKQAIAKRMKNKRGKRLNDEIYDFDFDAPMIFSAFMQTYHIDLNETYLHWWKFKAMFDSLPEECEFGKAMKYRATDISKVKDKDERHRIITLQNFYAIPSKLTADEKARRIGSMF